MPSDSEKERPRRTSWERWHLCCPEGEGKPEQIVGSQVTERWGWRGEVVPPCGRVGVSMENITRDTGMPLAFSDIHVKRKETKMIMFLNFHLHFS